MISDACPDTSRQPAAGVDLHRKMACSWTGSLRPSCMYVPPAFKTRMEVLRPPFNPVARCTLASLQISITRLTPATPDATTWTRVVPATIALEPRGWLPRVDCRPDTLDRRVQPSLPPFLLNHVQDLSINPLTSVVLISLLPRVLGISSPRVHARTPTLKRGLCADDADE